MSSSIPSNQTDFIQNEFDSFVINEIKLSVPNRGGSFHFNVCAQIPTERHLYDGDEVCTLDSAGSVDGFLQIFKASTNNIHTIQVSMLGSAIEDTIVDNFSSYSNTTALLSTYQYQSSYFIPSLGVDGDNKYMSAYLYRRGDGYRIYRNLSATPFDMSQYTGMSFNYQSGVAGSNNTMRLIISDGNNEAYMNFTSQNTWVWEKREFNFAAFTNVSLVDLSHITYVAIEAYSILTTTTVMMDDWVLSGGVTTNTTGIRIYDFGAEPNPTTLGVQIPQDYDNYRLEVELNPRKTIVSLGVNLGSHELDDTLTVDHYYGIYVEKPDIGTLKLFGSATQQYLSGKAYTVTGTSLVDTGASLGFMVMSAIEARLSSLTIIPDADPGDSKAFIFVTNMLTGATLFFAEVTLGSDGKALDLKDTLPEYLFTSRETMLSIYYKDAENSNVSNLIARPKYYYNSIPMNG